MKKELQSFEAEVDLSVYPLEAVQAAAYTFYDDCYCKISRIKDTEKAVVTIKAKEAGTELSEDVFFNELLHSTLRFRLSEKNQTIRERVVIQALSAAAGGQKEKTSEHGEEADVLLEQEIEKLLKEAESGSYKTDPLDISVPWEDKNAENKKNKTKN